MCLVQLKAATWWEVCFFEADVIRCLVRSSWVRGIARISGGEAGEERYGLGVIGNFILYFKWGLTGCCGFDLRVIKGNGAPVMGYGFKRGGLGLFLFYFVKWPVGCF